MVAEVVLVRLHSLVKLILVHMLVVEVAVVMGVLLELE
jgi:hypothetical protein